MPRWAAGDALTRLGNRLKARRVFLQLPLSHTAHEMGMSKNMLIAYEAGRSDPPAMTLLRMSKVLHTTTSDLLAERRKPHTDDLERAVRLMADPAISEVANTMARMDHPNRLAVVSGVREMAAHPLVSISA